VRQQVLPRDFALVCHGPGKLPAVEIEIVPRRDLHGISDTNARIDPEGYNLADISVAVHIHQRNARAMHLRTPSVPTRLAKGLRDKRETMEPESDALSRAKAFVQTVRSSEAQSRLPTDLRGRILERYPEILNSI
jgi:hypothetical protein